MKRLAIIIAIFAIIIIILPGGIAHAAPKLDEIVKDGETVEEDIAIFGGSLVIEEGGTVDGDVSIFGGVATIAGHVEGDVSVFGGSTEVSGSVDGDLVLFGGNLQANSLAAVDGDCVVVGGNFSGDGSLNCTTVGDFPDFAFPEGRSVLPTIPSAPRLSSGSNFFWSVASLAGQTLLFGLLALLVAVVAPRHLTQVKDTIRVKPVASGAVGFLTGVAGISLAVLLAVISAILTIVCIGLLGFPIVFILLVGLAVGALMGWAAIGVIVGQKLAKMFKLKNQSLTVTAALGTAVLTLAVGLLSSLPFLLGGWLWSLMAFVLLCIGLGAAALTRFGSRPYPPGMSENGEKVSAVLETLPVEDIVGDEPPAKGG